MHRRMHNPLRSTVLILGFKLAAALAGQSSPSEAAAKEGFAGQRGCGFDPWRQLQWPRN